MGVHRRGPRARRMVAVLVDKDVELMVIGSFLAGCATAAWVMWSRHMHKKGVKPLPERHHHHWLHKEAK